MLFAHISMAAIIEFLYPFCLSVGLPRDPRAFENSGTSLRDAPSRGSVKHKGHTVTVIVMLRILFGGLQNGLQPFWLKPCPLCQNTFTHIPLQRTTPWN